MLTLLLAPSTHAIELPARLREAVEQARASRSAQDAPEAQRHVDDAANQILAWLGAALCDAGTASVVAALRDVVPVVEHDVHSSWSLDDEMRDGSPVGVRVATWRRRERAVNVVSVGVVVQARRNANRVRAGDPATGREEESVIRLAHATDPEAVCQTARIDALALTHQKGLVTERTASVGCVLPHVPMVGGTPSC